jgi:hypothetical protein
MRGKKVKGQVIFVLFLISVVVLEVILRHEDRGKREAPARDGEAAEQAASSMHTGTEAGSLLALADAVQGETPLSPKLEETARKEESTREYNRGDARSK